MIFLYCHVKNNVKITVKENKMLIALLNIIYFFNFKDNNVDDISGNKSKIFRRTFDVYRISE